MSTLITPSETLLAPLPSQTSGPVELNVPVRGTARTTDSANPVGHDTVELSVSAQIQQLVQQGQTASEIANTLGLTPSLVDSYLYVPLPTTVSETATTPTVAL